MAKSIKVLHLYLSSLLFGVFLLMSTVMTFALGPSIESKYFPVLQNPVFNTAEIVDGELHIEMTATKTRPCRFLEADILVHNGNTWQRGNLDFGTPVRVNRPVGRQSFGFWTIIPPGDGVIFEFRYDCPETPWDNVTRFEWNPHGIRS